MGRFSQNGDFVTTQKGAMYKLDLPLEKKEAAAIARRQKNEEERKERIFDARTRIIGVDREALCTQVTERNQADAVDHARNNAYNNDMIRNDKLAVLLQERQDKDTHNLQQQLNNFRFQNQKPDASGISTIPTFSKFKRQFARVTATRIWASRRLR